MKKELEERDVVVQEDQEEAERDASVSSLYSWSGCDRVKKMLPWSQF